MERLAELGDRLHRRPARPRGARLPAVRLVGRHAVARPTTSGSCCPHSRRVFAELADRHPDAPGDPLRHRLRPPAGGDARRRARGDRARLAHADRRRPRAGSVPTSWCRATSTRRSCWPAPTPRWPAPTPCSPTTPAIPGTSSTSATASTPTATRACWPRSSRRVHARPNGRMAARSQSTVGRRGADGVRHATLDRARSCRTTPTSGAGGRPRDEQLADLTAPLRTRSAGLSPLARAHRGPAPRACRHALDALRARPYRGRARAQARRPVDRGGRRRARRRRRRARSSALVLAPHYSALVGRPVPRPARRRRRPHGVGVTGDRVLGDRAGVRRLPRRRARRPARARCRPDAGWCSPPTRCRRGSSTPATRTPTELRATAEAVAGRGSSWPRASGGRSPGRAPGARPSRG